MLRAARAPPAPSWRGVPTLYVWPLPCGSMCSRHGYTSGQTASLSAVLASVTSGCNRGRAPPAPCSPAREDASLKETVENGHAYANEHEHVCVMQPSGRGSGLRLPGRRVRWASGARAAVRSCVDPQKNQSDACAAASSAHSCAGAMSREDQSMRVFCKRWSLRASPSPAPSLRTDVDCIKA